MNLEYLFKSVCFDNACREGYLCIHEVKRLEMRAAFKRKCWI